MAVESRWAGVTVGAGQRPSFDDYVRARGAGLLRLAWLITRNFEDAHDAVQDAFASLLPRWSGLPEGARLEAYVSRCRQNPEMPLEPALVDELFAMLEDQTASLEQIGMPDFKLGFRGFVVTWADQSRPPLRILPDIVYVDRGEIWEQLDDPEGNFYTRVYDAISASLPDDVREAIPEPEPGIPDVTAPVPPLRGAVATWELLDAETVGPDSTKLTVGVTQLGCSNGKTGQLLEPVVSIGEDDMVIRVDAQPLGEGGFNCPGNDVVPVEVTLLEPLGDRKLVDAACLAGEALRTASCATGAVRWQP